MSIRIQRFIAIVSVLLFAGKLWAWYLTHSVLILTDALESIVNVAAGFMGLYSVILAAVPRDTNHPYGHGKVEFISSAVEGTLIIVAGFVTIYQSIHQLIIPRQLQSLDMGVLIVFGTGIINFGVGKYAEVKGKKHHSVVVESAGKHLLSDAYSTFAIIIGLLLLLVTHNKWMWLDSAVALVFSCIIIVTGYKVLRRSLSGIMDEVDTKLLAEIIDLLQKNRKPQWVDLHNLRVIQYGSIMHVDAHMTLPWYYQVVDADKEIHDLESLIKEHFSRQVELFIHIDGCLPYQCKLCALENCTVRQHSFQHQVEWSLTNVWTNKKHGEVDDKEA